MINHTFRIGQAVQLPDGQRGSFMAYGGYKHTTTGETVAQRGIVYLGNGKAEIVDLETIKAVEEVAGG